MASPLCTRYDTVCNIPRQRTPTASADMSTVSTSTSSATFHNRLATASPAGSLYRAMTESPNTEVILLSIYTVVVFKFDRGYGRMFTYLVQMQ